MITRALLSRVIGALHGFLTRGAGATALADIGAAFGHLARNPHLGKIALGIVVALYLLSGVYIVNPGEEAVVRRFGQVTQRRVSEGLHYRLPSPIERADVVNVSQIRREGIGLRPPEHEVALHPAEEPQILTGDENIVSVKVIVQYRVKDPADYVLRVDYDANTLIRNTVRDVIVTLGGRSVVDDLLTTGRPDLQRAILANAQKALDNYQSGLQLVSVNLQEVYPPKEVADAFRNVSSAREEKEATINDAQGYANSVLPKARGDAQRINQEAVGYVAQVTNRAKGDAQRFGDVLKEYRLASRNANASTDVTRYRYFVETMEQVLGKVKKYVIDPRTQNIRIVQ
ncbi:MAG: FtsH protease activity modulator HflK [Chloroflexi bacterium]|nr:FtsH protease activity modulator HflK [Chloroflexota bacterium]